MAVTVTVEDGSGVSNANSYQSVQDWKAYADQHGWDYSDYTDDQIGSALIRGTAWLDASHLARFSLKRPDPFISSRSRSKTTMAETFPWRGQFDIAYGETDPMVTLFMGELRTKDGKTFIMHDRGPEDPRSAPATSTVWAAPG